MTSKILFLVGSYDFNQSANGICSKYVIEEFIKKGFEVHCICFGEQRDEKYEDNVYIHHVKLTFRYKLLNKYKKTNKKKYLFFAKIISIINYYNFPFINPILNYRYKKETKNLVKKNQFDIIVSVYNPVESLSAGIAANKISSNSFFVMYTLDTLTNITINKKILEKYKYIKNRMYEKHVYKKFDYIINMKCHENHYNLAKYSDYQNKMCILDIPLMKTCQSNIIKPKFPLMDLKKKNLLYTGVLNKDYRNPEYFCKLLVEIYKNNPQIKMNFFVRGNCKDILSYYETKYPDLIKYNDFVEHKYIPYLMSNSDFLVCISSSNTQMVSSKIFEYISYRKKIILIYKDKNDILIPYLKKYKNTLFINENDDFNKNINKLNEFINDKGKNIQQNLSEIEKIFKNNLPEHTVNNIIKSYNDWRILK